MNIADKDFRAVIINWFKEQRDTTIKEFKEDRMTVFQQV